VRRRPIIATVLITMFGVAALAVAPAAAQARVKPLRISNVHTVHSYPPAAAYTEFRVTAPRHWTIRRPSRCKAIGFENGVRRRGWGTGRPSRWIHARFARGVTVGNRPLTIRCRRLRHHYWTNERVHRWVGHSKERRGVDTSRRANRGSCHFSSLSGDLTLDCWGGRYALAKYTFGLPGDARDVHHSDRGSVGCCNFGGKISRSWNTTRNGNLAYLVRVTGWRAYTVRRVRVSYETRVVRHERRRHTEFARGYGKLR
jgi:hypothetical protein